MRLTAAIGLVFACAPVGGPSGTCGPWDGVHGTLPTDGAIGVGVNVKPLVRFSDGRGGGAELSLWAASGGEVLGTTEQRQKAWVFSPTAPLSPNTEYRFAFEARDVDPVTIRFVTGDGEDVEPPFVPDPTASSWEWLPPGENADPCGAGDFEKGSFAVELSIPPVGGEVDPRQVENVVFNVTDGPVEVAFAFPASDGSSVATVTLSEEKVEGETCFVVVARDVAGNPSGATSETCVELEPGPFFESCSVGSGGARRPAAVVLAVVVVALALSSRRRRTPT